VVLRWLRREEAEQRAAPVSPADEVAELRTRLQELVDRTNRSADRLPVGVVPQVRAIEDQLRELLDHAAATTGSSISASERFSLATTIEDYLPSSLDAYLALPDSFVATHRTPEGRTAGEELLEQLILLDTSIRELALAVYSGDAERLSTQGRFLDTKFGRKDLDLR
jgi:hypothetical protein